jgi:hypothetical protein
VTFTAEEKVTNSSEDYTPSLKVNRDDFLVVIKGIELNRRAVDT